MLCYFYLIWAALVAFHWPRWATHFQNSTSLWNNSDKMGKSSLYVRMFFFCVVVVIFYVTFEEAYCMRKGFDGGYEHSWDLLIIVTPR